jgi:hypothetical protein
VRRRNHVRATARSDRYTPLGDPDLDVSLDTADLSAACGDDRANGTTDVSNVHKPSPGVA